jgi:hypothetical protein
MTRCSSLPLLCSCPAAGVAPDVRIQSNDDAARLGSAVHEAHAARLAGQDVDFGDLAKRYLIDAEELGILANWLWAQWQHIANDFPDPRTEVAITGSWLSGHVDLISLPGVYWDPETLVADSEPTEARLVDWKTGRTNTNYEPQLLGYAALLCETFPSIQEVYTVVMSIRHDTDRRWWTKAQIESWGRETRLALQQTDRYSPGDHCKYCPRTTTCPAIGAMLQQGAHMLMHAEPGELSEADPHTLASMLSISRNVRGRCEDIEKAISARTQALIAAAVAKVTRKPDEEEEAFNARVKEASTYLRTGRGTALKLTTQQHKKIDYAAGLPVLEKHLLPGALAECCSVSKTKAEAAVRALVPRGQKKDAEESLMSELAAADAIRLHPVVRLEVVRVEADHLPDTAKMVEAIPERAEANA